MFRLQVRLFDGRLETSLDADSFKLVTSESGNCVSNDMDLLSTE